MLIIFVLYKWYNFFNVREVIGEFISDVEFFSKFDKGDNILLLCCFFLKEI